MINYTQQPKAKAIGGAIGASFVVTGFIISILYASGKGNKKNNMYYSDDFVWIIYMIWFFTSFTSSSVLNSFQYLKQWLGQKVHTMTPEWKAANKEYMKFQKMNPISGN